MPDSGIIAAPHQALCLSLIAIWKRSLVQLGLGVALHIPCPKQQRCVLPSLHAEGPFEI